jgi:glyoxylase-like metal-dependent hydrolase (beta-lactamase superfamily II)
MSYQLHVGEIVQVKVPLPFSLRFVNSYIIAEQDGVSVIDPGLHTEEAVNTWEEVLLERGIAWDDVKQIVLTHYHPDHYGLAGLFQERSSAPVFISEEGYKHAQRLWGKEHEAYAEQIKALYVEHGMPQELTDQIVPHLNSFVANVSPHPKVTYMEAGGEIVLGNQPYHLLHTPGHALGHLCFYQAESQVIFCGDQVLPQISPNVSYLPGSDANPLASFLASLQELASLPVKQAYPGHREPFTAFGKRVQELLEHHAERLSFVLGQLTQPSTAYEICRAMFGDKLSVHQLRFAMSETLAHLVYLVCEGSAAQEQRGDLALFTRAQ